uniref:Uncharacterized protein n=1 Tax=Setaria viridis TaxID=4556 RepID=A0A4U6VS79_SETVI|nr:hypothetical protein SEVIR_2G129266v2 [Setaria viridis]
MLPGGVLLFGNKDAYDFSLAKIRSETCSDT